MYKGNHWTRGRGPCQQHELKFYKNPDLTLHEVWSCRFCGLSIEGELYCCNQFCDISYCHKACLAEAPFLIEHPFHPQHPLFLHPPPPVDHTFSCNACGDGPHLISYRCSICPFQIDFKCSKLTPKSSNEGDVKDCSAHSHGQVLLPTHPHPFFVCEKDDKSLHYVCSYCDRYIGGPIFACLECHVLMHEGCAKLTWQINHPFHPSHPLSLIANKFHEYSSFKCSICHGEWRELRHYVCEDCDFHLDLHCASLIPVENQQSVLRPSHTHSLLLFQNNKQYYFSTTCHGCRDSIDKTTDLVYFCSECKIFMHKACAESLQEVRHPLDPIHPLTLDLNVVEATERCSLCGYNFSGGLVYRCSQCNIALELQCALLFQLTTMMSVNHDRHYLVLIKNPYPYPLSHSSLKCIICKEQFHHYSLFFHCLPCKLSLHVHCLPVLPTTVKSGRHRHFLTLTHSRVKDQLDENDNTEFVCDNCEEPRILGRPTYVCGECHFVSHVDCLVHEVISELEKEGSVARKLEGANFKVVTSRIKELIGAHFEKDSLEGGPARPESSEKDVEEAKKRVAELDKEIDLLQKKKKEIQDKINLSKKNRLNEVEKRLRQLEEELDLHRQWR